MQKNDLCGKHKFMTLWRYILINTTFLTEQKNEVDRSEKLTLGYKQTALHTYKVRLYGVMPFDIPDNLCGLI